MPTTTTLPHETIATMFANATSPNPVTVSNPNACRIAAVMASEVNTPIMHMSMSLGNQSRFVMMGLTDANDDCVSIHRSENTPPTQNPSVAGMAV